MILDVAECESMSESIREQAIYCLSSIFINNCRQHNEECKFEDIILRLNNCNNQFYKIVLIFKVLTDNANRKCSSKVTVLLYLSIANSGNTTLIDVSLSISFQIFI